MTNFEKLVNSSINTLSVDEILLRPQYEKLAQEAKEAASIFEKIANFPARTDKVEIWQDRDGYNHEYVTHDGMWQARYLHQTYDVLCDKESIFKMYKEDYLCELYRKEYRSEPSGDLSFLRYSAEVTRYFRSFINRMKTKLARDNT